jgi:hypothetical protein
MQANKGKTLIETDNNNLEEKIASFLQGPILEAQQRPYGTIS